LLSTPSLYLFFSVKGLVNSVIFFVIDQPDRQSLAGIVCTLTIFMLLYAEFQVNRAAGIEAAIVAFENVHVSIHTGQTMVASTPLSHRPSVRCQSKSRFRHQDS